MKWIEALKKWNELNGYKKNDKSSKPWCVPKKNTDDYDEVRALMENRESKRAIKAKEEAKAKEEIQKSKKVLLEKKAKKPQKNKKALLEKQRQLNIKEVFENITKMLNKKKNESKKVGGKRVLSKKLRDWVNALKEWNAKSEKWCVPIKNTKEYHEVKALYKKEETPKPKEEPKKEEPKPKTKAKAKAKETKVKERLEATPAIQAEYNKLQEEIKSQRKEGNRLKRQYTNHRTDETAKAFNDYIVGVNALVDKSNAIVRKYKITVAEPKRKK